LMAAGIDKDVSSETGIRTIPDEKLKKGKVRAEVAARQPPRITCPIKKSELSCHSSASALRRRLGFSIAVSGFASFSERAKRNSTRAAKQPGTRRPAGLRFGRRGFHARMITDGAPRLGLVDLEKGGTTFSPDFPDDLGELARGMRRNPGIPNVSDHFLPE